MGRNPTANQEFCNDCGKATITHSSDNHENTNNNSNSGGPVNHNNNEENRNHATSDTSVSTVKDNKADDQSNKDGTEGNGHSGTSFVQSNDNGHGNGNNEHSSNNVYQENNGNDNHEDTIPGNKSDPPGYDAGCTDNPHDFDQPTGNPHDPEHPNGNPHECFEFVVPESPVGMIALLTSSLSALGGYLYLKR